MRWFFSLIIFLFALAGPAFALQGVGALADRVVEGGVGFEISGKTAPWAEVVVANESQDDEILAVAEVESGGDFEFSFKAPRGELEGLVIFGVDKLGITSRLAITDVLGPLRLGNYQSEEFVLAPTIVNDLDDNNQERVALTGFGYGESRVDIHIYSKAGFDRVYKVKTDKNGRWRLAIDDLDAGKYTAAAQIFTQKLKSKLSQEIYFEVGGGGLTVDSVAKLANTTLAQIIKKPEQTAKTVVPVAAATMFLPFLFENGLALLLRLFLAFLSLFGWGKRRKSWGMVYDAVTKRPLSRAIVRLFDAGSGKLLETDVTGKEGVFSFLPRPGEYFLRVARAGFNFPSRLVRGVGSDGEYAHLYHGEKLKIAADEAVVISAPLDPVKYKPGFWFYARRYGSILWNVASWILLAVGLVSSGLALWREFSGLNLMMFVVEVVILMWILWQVRRRVRGWSVVVDGRGRPLAGVSVSLYELEFRRMARRRVTDERGRFQMIAPAGRYKLEVGKEGYVVDLGRKGGFDGGVIEVKAGKEKAIRVRVFLRKI